MLKPCLTCGALSPSTRCPTHTPKRGAWSANRDRAAQARFRQAVLDRDQHRCVDCGSTHDLRACHVIPLHNGGGYEPAYGLTRCRRCDIATDPHAR